MQQQNDSLEWMSHIPPHILFWGGLVGGILAVCTIGFFILLGMMVGGKSFGAFGGSGAGQFAENNGAPTQQPSNNQQPPAPGFKKPAAVSGEDHIFGNRNAKVTLVEFSDYQCPFCQRVHQTLERIVNESGGKVRWVYRHFPLESIHPMAQKAAEASECVASLRGNDAYWKYASELFAKQSSLSESMLADVAVGVGVNKTAFETCLKSGKFASKVKGMQRDGEQSGVEGTPATFVLAGDGSFEVVPGAQPFENIKQIVDRALQK